MIWFRSQQVPHAVLTRQRGPRAWLRNRREERRDARASRRLLTEPPFSCLRLADYEGPRWVGGYGAAGKLITDVSLGHGEPFGEYVRVTTTTRPLGELVEDLEETARTRPDQSTSSSTA